MMKSLHLDNEEIGMAIASGLLQQYIKTLVDDNARWQALIADDIRVGTRLRTVARPSSKAVRTFEP
jgi:hypothetical protein